MMEPFDFRKYVLLLTGLSRKNVVSQVAYSVRRVIDRYPGMEFRWAICMDQYNGKEDESVVVSTIERYGLKDVTTIYHVGKPNQANYGGDLYNEPLFDQMEAYYTPKGIDPWVCFLDDDNILDEHFFMLFNNGMLTDKHRIVWLDYDFRGGEQHITRSNALNLDIEGYALNNSDPSCVSIRASLIIESGGINGGLDYDFSYVRPLVYANMDKTLLQYDIMQNCGYTYAYHNFLRTESDFESDEENIEDATVTLRIQDNVKFDYPTKYEVPTPLKRPILMLIKTYYKDKGLI